MQLRYRIEGTELISQLGGDIGYWVQGTTDIGFWGCVTERVVIGYITVRWRRLSDRTSGMAMVERSRATVDRL